ncbi:MAG TPA: LemA family protein [Pirellulales bacterium]|jgi:LemA protein|nr:LemA family protein [Pirellulales bacterium]
MKPLLIGCVIIVAVALLVGGCATSFGIAGYNRAKELDQNVQSEWAQVEVQLQRRFDLVPQLEATVKGAAGQEQKVFLGIANARKAYFQADKNDVPAKAAAANDFNTALSRLLMLQEQYPQLKSNEAFLKMQDTIEGTENRLSVERNRYNEAVRQLDLFTQTFPNSFFAQLAAVRPAPYLKPPENVSEAPKIDFSKP